MNYKIAILLLLSLLSISGSIYLFIKSKKKYFSLSILSLYLLIIGLIFLETLVINYFGHNNAHPLIVLYSYLFFVLCLALPPTFYLYVSSLVSKKEKQLDLKTFQWLYGPAISLLVINLFSYIALYNIAVDTQNYKMVQNVLMYCNFISIFFIFLLQNIYYLIKSWQLYFSQKVILQGSQSKETNFTLKWMWWFIMLFTILISSLYLFQLKPLLPGKMIFRIFTLFYVGTILYFGSKNYKFTQESKQVQQLDDDKSEELKRSLLAFMEKNKPHLSPELTLKLLAQELGSNSKYLSYIINKEFNCNFSSFINRYRINEAKEFLSDPENNIYTIESIAYKTGFKSKSAFNAAFKKITNLTPSKFKVQNIENN